MPDTDEWGRVPLHYAAMEKPIDEVRRLLEGADTPDPVDNEGWTPLLYAARRARVDVVRALLDAGARVDAVNDKGYPALYWALTAPSRDDSDPVATIRLLRERGADPTAKTMKGYFGLKSPLDHLRKIGYSPEIEAEFADLL